MITHLIQDGVNVFRLNSSHGQVEEHRKIIHRIQRIRKELQTPVGILVDLEGPKIRTGHFDRDEVELVEGQPFFLTAQEIRGDQNGVSISYPQLPKEVHSGDIILLYDGLVGLKVLESDGVTIKTIVQNSGTLSHRKGINVPGVDIGLPPLTDKDLEFLRLAVENDVEYVAQSFVRRPDDIDLCREEIRKLQGDIPIIAKIETRQAMGYLKSILYRANGVMVARGDLGVEIPTEDVPLAQKKIIRMANQESKPVITATQMLESMIENPRPTRAEASDIANAIIDGTDAIMLSAETTVGKHPRESVQVMDHIALRIEEHLDELKSEYRGEDLFLEALLDSEEEAISRACWDISRQLEIRVIITSTVTGKTARQVSKYRPNAMLVGTTPDPRTYFRLALVWGVLPVLIHKTNSTDEMIEKSVQTIVDGNLIRRGERVIITAGIPWGHAGTTNLLKIHVC